MWDVKTSLLFYKNLTFGGEVSSCFPSLLPNLKLLFFVEECGGPLWGMEYWNPWPSCTSWTRPGKMGLVMAEVDLPGKRSYFRNQIFLFIFKGTFSLIPATLTGWTERRSHESCISKFYFLCWLDAWIISCTKTAAIDLAQGRTQRKLKSML